MTNLTRGLTPTTTIERTWEGLSGAILHFPVSIALSGRMAAEREGNTLLTPDQRAERLLDFRFKTLADVLTEAPYLVFIEDLQRELEAKQNAAMEGIEDAEEAARIRRQTRLTKEEVDVLRQPFPGYEETQGETLAEKAYAYFSQEDETGRKIFQLLVEEVISDYWYWVTPRPTISVSAFMQGK